MKKLIFLSTMFFCCTCLGASKPEASISFKVPPPSTIFYGDTLRIPVQMNYYALPNYKEWFLPPGSTLEAMSGGCPAIPVDKYERQEGSCSMNLVVPGNTLGKVISGVLTYKVSNGYEFRSPTFSITVIPHPLSMSLIPIQTATAGQNFVYNLKPAVQYYNENVLAGKTPQAIITPEEQDGLRFDKASFSIIGKPERIGTYLFNVAVKNANGSTKPVVFEVNVGVNLKNKPQFKAHYPIATAMPDQQYTMNLMDLIMSMPELMKINQISFRVDKSLPNLSGLDVPEKDSTLLTGKIPVAAAGEEIKVNLIAASNTGGDSSTFTIKIPVATDPTKKPTIEPFTLEQLVGANIYKDLAQYIKDPAQAPDLKVLLDKVEPPLPGLSISKTNPTVLEGIAPEDTTQTYQLTLRASTLIGGSSEPVTIPLHIYKDKSWAPQFKSSSPNIPILNRGESFFYDFAANKDIYPEYNEAPYEVSFADEFIPPTWLKLENNKLHANLIPEDIGNNVDLDLVIRNEPGGSSNVYHLVLSVK